MALKALLVDDDRTVLGTLKGLFEYKKFEVTTAQSVQGAAEALAKAAYDLVVTDMRMESETSGYEVVRKAKAVKNAPVVVILSAYPIPTAEWQSSGADAMYVKGGGVFRILDDLERMVRGYKFRKRHSA